MKIAIIYAYNGAKFQGSQTQPNGKAVEDALNLALRKIGVFSPVISSSRTDAGVHALMQLSSVDVGDFWDLTKLKNELNRHLPASVFVKNVKKVNADFHPRYSAKARAYRYLLFCGRQRIEFADLVCFCAKPDMKVLNEALRLFCGERDFSGFYKSGSNEKSPVRRLFYARARARKTALGEFVIIAFKGNGFLRSQVRLMVANALECAKNPEKLEILKNRLENKSQAVPTKIPAPAAGLYLKKVFYS